METRKSIILHFDSLDVIDELSEKQIAELFIAIRDYNLGKEIKLDGLMKAIFIPFKNQFDRDLEKYKKKCEVNAENINKRWNKNIPNYTSGINGIPTDTNYTYNKNDNNNDNKNKKDNIKKEFIEYSNLYKEDNKNIGSYLLNVFLDLGYIPAKDETLETFRLWFKEKIIDSHKLDGIGELRQIINNYSTYWNEQEKKPKNFKTSFLNNPILSSKRK